MGKSTRARAVDPGRVEPPLEQLGRGAWDHRQIHDPETGHPINVRRNLSTRNLERWYNRQLIDDTALIAGGRYRDDYELTGFLPKVTACYDIVTAGGQGAVYSPPMPGSLRQMDAWRRYRDARAAIDPARVWGFDSLILHDVLWADVPAAADGSRPFTRDRWAGMVKLCLAELVAYYRL